MKKEYDAVIIGGGGGLKIARPAANLGYRIAVVEPGPLGGTCLNRGCIPSKMLIHPADVVQQLNEASSFEVLGAAQVDFKKLIKRVNTTVDAESQSIVPLLENHPNVDFYPYSARFLDNKSVEVNGEILFGKKFFIAAGARPAIPQIPGLQDTPFMTSTELLRRENLPKKVIILGGGYIACELGHYLGAMGVEVCFIVRSKLLSQLDETIQKTFAQAFSNRFKVIQGLPDQVTYQNDEFRVFVNDKELISDALLVSTGVVPNSDQLNLKAANIETNESGFIKVDDHLQTSQKSIYAFGDIIGRYLFRHSVNFEGEYLLYEHFENLNSNKSIEYPPIPYGVFTWPQIAGVGKTENDLKKEQVSYLVGVNEYKDSAMGMALQTDVGLVKLLFDKKTLKLLGAHCIGEQATTLIHMLIAYLNCDATLNQILRTVYIHPALPEVIRNAARKVRAQLNEAKNSC
ncbi:MAG: Mycothione reductase [Chlamydiae bacterium]|nr:Mycothione reductase [Chlamydiota bacterium]